MTTGIEKLYDRSGKYMYSAFYKGDIFPPIQRLSEILPKIKKLEFRSNDVFLCAYPTSGTHWMWEVASMLLQGKAERIRNTKEESELVLLSSKELDAMQSPRLINIHLHSKYLPESVLQTNKIIWVVRNPKDVAVSYYNLMTGIIPLGYNGDFVDFLELFLEGKVHYGNWFDYTYDWWKHAKNMNFLTVSYEEAKQDLVLVTQKIAEFLGNQGSVQFYEDIAALCAFQRMKDEKQITSIKVPEGIWKPNQSFYRTGEVGNWKKWFTVAQSEHLDAIYQKKLGSNINFQFSI